MDKKGFATSAILYTILLLFLVLMVGILNNLQNKKTILDQLKLEVLSSMEVADTIDTENPQASVSLQSATAYITMTDNTGVFEYAIVASGEEPAEWTRTEILKIVTIKWSIPQAGTYSVWVKDIYENVSHTEFTIKNSEFCAYQPGDVVKTFEYTGSIEEFSIPCSGIYKLEVFGAQGGSYGGTGGAGGYSYGNINFLSNQIIFVTVGGAGGTSTSVGGYNGGGNGGYYSSDGRGAGGGGSTHISTTKTVLKDTVLENLIIIAGGGGGGLSYKSASYNGGVGGGTSGNSGTAISGYGASVAGTQSTGFAFGLGGGTSVSSSCSYGGSGSGYYGGQTSCGSSGSGGSGYLNISQLISGTTGMQNGARSGNGYARITLISLTD